jgi:glycosyltransferase involved in cell wall biosynthesis
MSNVPEFSLVVSTKGRVEEVARLFTSLGAQSERSFDVIVSDQNDDDRLAPVIATFGNRFPIKHLRSSGGASRGRNVGLYEATGRYITFPDDDCWYPPDLLATVKRLFCEHADWKIICGRSVGPDMIPTQGRWAEHPTHVTRRNVLRMMIEYTIFGRAEAIKAAGPFDETIGIGAGTIWGGGEGPDLLLNAIRNRDLIMYTPEINVFHPEKMSTFSRSERDRQFGNSRGIGRVLGKHHYSLAEMFEHLIRPLGGSVIYLLSGKPQRSAYHWRMFAGRSRGWLDRPADSRSKS